MSTPARPAGRPEAQDGASADVPVEAPIEVDLQAGRVAITPVNVDGESRYAFTELPDEPLTQDDVEGLAEALRVARSHQAVLVDIQDYVQPDPPDPTEL